LFLISGTLSAQTTFYVSPSGKDSNNGSKTEPFATIERAKEEAAKMTTATTTIYVRQGTYYLSKPVTFTSNDARSKESPLIIKNYENEQVTLSGGVPLKLKWLPHSNGIYKAQVPKGIVFDQLIVNGQSQRMARYPNYDPKARFLGGTAADAISKERAATWASPEGGYVHALHKHEWGGFHYKITGKDENGEPQLEGGWQNNRPMGMHDKYRYVENIAEELDVVNEWFFDKKTSTLYFYPSTDLDMKTATVESPQIAHLVEFKGSENRPVSYISIKGLTLTQTLRTFMETKEPLLRSDWTIYRGAAVLYDGAENCSILQCKFVNLGGNAIFLSNYNRHCEISGNLFSEIGASAVCFVGDVGAVRSPRFGFDHHIPFNELDRTPGPKTNNYPAECSVYDNLMFNLGLVEKQSAGVEISMSMDITVSHNTIYDVPRAGINISEGTWGGHIIEYNDVFDTVKETGDHGSFNSWGRDRYWYPNKKTLDSIVENDFDLVLVDAIKPVIIRHNRMRCDHGWDIDLDDGSSNYCIYNNLCLNGGLKLREGVNRTVENNIIINNSFHPHVWFRNSNDVFRHNIIMTRYKPIRTDHWGKELDYNVFPDRASLEAAQANGTDKNSVYGDPMFIDPQSGDFRVAEGSPALRVGFKNFSMDDFGVVSPELKQIAKRVTIPRLMKSEKIVEEKVLEYKGIKLKNLSSLGEQSATGMDKINNVLVMDVNPESEFAEYFEPNDVILSIDQKPINKLEDFMIVSKSVTSSVEVIIFRNQVQQTFEIKF
jgi:hypothetical protein